MKANREKGCSAFTWKGAIVIRQVITCDMCGCQKQQTNHWFLAYEESGELRISGWNSHYLTSPGTKHLCGETCAHKLISQFLMTAVRIGMQPAAEKHEPAPDAQTAMSAGARVTPPPGTWQEDAQTSQRSPEDSLFKRSHSCSGRSL